MQYLKWKIKLELQLINTGKIVSDSLVYLVDNYLKLSK